MKLQIAISLLVLFNTIPFNLGIARQPYLDKHGLKNLIENNAEDPTVQLEDGDVDIITKLVKVAKGHTQVIRHSLLPLFERVENGPKLLEDALRALEEEEPEEPVDDWSPAGCGTCQILLTVLKAAATAIDWEDMRDPLYFVCVHVGVIIIPWLRADVLCGGAIDSQGPVVYDMLRSANLPRRHCEFLNSCFPPKPEGMKDYPFLPTHTPTDQKKTKAEQDAHTERLESAIKVAAIADVHLEPNYAAGSSVDCGLPMCCLSTWGAGPANRWGDFACNVPEPTMDLFTKKANDLGVDFIITLGDTPHHHLWDEDEETRLGCSTKLARAIERDVPNTRAYPTLGNHENYPTNIYNMDDEFTPRLNERLIEDFRNLSAFTPENEASIRASGYYATRVKEGLMLISWNTNYMFADNWMNVITEDLVNLPVGRNPVRAMEQFVENAFEEARQNGDKVILIGHHPLGGGTSILVLSRWMTQVISKYKDIIVLQAIGHNHVDQFRIVRDLLTGVPATVQFNVPVIDTGSTRNPSIRVFYLDPADFSLLDFDQYHMDLRDAVVTDTPEIKLIYRASEEYGLPDMSVQSWWDLTARMLHDPALMNQFDYNRRTRTSSGNCAPGSCTISRVCQTANANFDYVHHCELENMPDPPTTTVASTTTDGNTPEPPETGSGTVTGISSFLVTCLFALLLIERL